VSDKTQIVAIYFLELCVLCHQCTATFSRGSRSV